MLADELSLISALLIGLFGSVHCLGMCGGIVSALTLGLDERLRRAPAGFVPFLLLYNAGRIASYAVAGALAGGLGALVYAWVAPDAARLVARLVSACFTIALGLYLTGWWSGLVVLEQLGGRIWRRLEPFGRRFLPVRTPLQALAAGIVWGWLPCGMVYAALAWAASGGSGAHGALLMAAFGAGTLPMMVAAGAAAERFVRLVRHRAVRAAAGLFVIGFGLYVLLVAGTGHGGHEPRHDPSTTTAEPDPRHAHH